MLMRGVTLLAVYVVVATALVASAAWQLMQPGWWEWLLLWVVAVPWPVIWTYRTLQLLPPDWPERRRRAVAWSPVIVGATTMMAALSLIERLVGR